VRTNHRLISVAAFTTIIVATLPPPIAGASDPVSLIVEVPGQGPFADDDGSVFEDDIAALASAGIATGCSVGRFCPDGPVTRGQMAAFLRRSRPQLLAISEPSPFVDTIDSVFEDDIAALASAGATAGCGNGRYCPDRPVTRGEMAAFLHRIFADAFGLTTEAAAFADTTSNPFEADIRWLAQTGITAGCGDSSHFCPDAPVTRGEMAAFLRRALDLPAVELTDTVEIDLAVPTGPGVEGWRHLVEHFFEPGDVSRALAVMACESHGDPNANSPNSSASGLYQHLASRFPARAEAAGFEGSSVFDPVVNVAVAAHLVHTDGWWHWNASRSCWS
jgi:hypothetical protein